jgi:hypothetical protein
VQVGSKLQEKLCVFRVLGAEGVQVSPTGNSGFRAPKLQEGTVYSGAGSSL